ncbi:BTB/POZ-like protein [Colletotrichum higginsianum]|nr:BTB/POZ-like protein [Colletotrichum higginsianum]
MAEEFSNEPEIVEDAPANPAAADVEMEGVGEDGNANANANANEGDLPFAEGGENDPVEPRTTFVSYLSSPVVTLLVGQGESEAIVTAHQALLVKSPFFKEACAQFSDDGSPRQVELVGEDLDAVGCFLEYLYTGEYFPRKLLKHARVYTLAEKFGVPGLRTLASSKIHCVNSTAKGEIAYARYVYAYTSKDDTTIRAPVASFWATRSHTLRSEAEEEFRSLCLEYPQFGYDVLTRVLDEKLKRERNDKLHPSSSTGSARKRARHSQI